MTHFSLCSGVGGLDLAAGWAGFKTIGQSEIDDYASKVLAKNFKGVKNYGDIRTITAERLAQDGIKRGTITVISAGIPCQPYSLAGKGLGDGDERDLEQELIRVVNELHPKWVVVENTPGLFARKNQRYFHRILSDLSALGYSLAWGIWGAVDVGARHKRDRVFIVAYTSRFGRGSIFQNMQNGCSQNYLQIRELEETREASSREKINTLLGLARELPQSKCGVIRNDNGLSSGLDRIRCLGNAVVPQQAYPIFRAIADYEMENKCYKNT